MLRRIAGGADRVVVVDTETTGLYNRDRIVEIAIVTLSLDGDVLEEWDTLVYPARDVGAFHIHGITASMVESAPAFQDVIGDVAIRLDGACFAAHNVSFDERMVSGEFDRVGVPIRFGSGLDTLRATGARLGEACAQHGFKVDGAHRALADARATARLLCLVAGRLEPGTPTVAGTDIPRSGRTLRREDLQPARTPDPPLIVHLASKLAFSGLDVESLAYLEVVGRAVADLHLDPDERKELSAIAIELGLGADHIKRAHRRFINELIDVALADHVVTDDEYNALVRVAACLNVDQALVERRIRSTRTTTANVTLDLGLRVVFTGAAEIPRSELTTHADKLGLDVQKNVTKRTELLVAADPSSASGKAGKARNYQIPIMDAAVFLTATLGQVIFATLDKTLSVIMCPECLVTWTVRGPSGEHSSRVCDDCSRL